MAPAISDPYSRAALWTEIAKVLVATEPDHARRLLADAATAAGTAADPDPWRFSWLLRDLAPAMYALDPAGAERAVRSIADPSIREDSVAELVDVAIEHDPDDAERLARTITAPRHQARTLAAIARRVVAYDPVRSRRLLRDAERLARTITDPDDLALALRSIVWVVVPSDLITNRSLLDEAKRIADTIAGPIRQGEAWVTIARAIAADDPAEARSLLHRTQRHTYGEGEDAERESILLSVVKVMIPVDLEDAVSVARSITYIAYRDKALVEILRAVAAIDPERAERIAHNIYRIPRRAEGLAFAARASAEGDPANARWLLENAQRLARSADKDFSPDPVIFGAVAQIVATYDPDHAEHIISEENFPNPDSRGWALSRIAKIVGEHDLNCAERIAYAIDSPQARSYALVECAKRHADDNKTRRIA